MGWSDVNSENDRIDSYEEALVCGNKDVIDWFKLVHEGKIKRGERYGKWIWAVTDEDIEKTGNSKIIKMWNHQFPDAQISVKQIGHNVTNEKVKKTRHNKSSKLKKD